MYERAAYPQAGDFIRWRVRDSKDPVLFSGFVRWVDGDMLCIEAMDWSGIYFRTDVEVWRVPPEPVRPSLWSQLMSRFNRAADAA